MKRFVSLCLMALSCFIISSCGSSKSASTNSTVDLGWLSKKLEQSAGFRINVRNIQPLKGSIRQISDGYSLTLKKDTLQCDLPYVGSMSVPPSSRDALSIASDKQVVTPSIKPSKKGDSYNIYFTFTNKYSNEKITCSIDLFTSGIAYISMSSVVRERIRYTGYVTYLKEGE